MLTSMYYLKDSISRLLGMQQHFQEILTEGVLPKFNITLKNTFTEVIYDLRLALLEADCTSNFNDYSTDLQTVNELMSLAPSTFESLDNLKRVHEIVSKLTVRYDNNKFDYNDTKLTQLHAAYRLTNTSDAKNGYTERNIDDSVINAFVKSLKTHKNRDLNVLHVGCKNGGLGEQLSQAKKQLKLWGVQPNPSFKNYGIYQKVLNVSIHQIKISTSCFDILVWDPPVKIDGSNILNHKYEVEMLNISDRHLRSGGVLFMVIPFFRLSRDLCLYLAKNYSKIQIFYNRINMMESNFCVYITAEKRTVDRRLNQEAYKLLRNAADLSTLPALPEFTLQEYFLPMDLKEIASFQTIFLTKEDVQDALNKSSVRKDFFSAQFDHSEKQQVVRPPLNLTVDQLGLLLTAGYMDGVIDEKNGCYHAVKGRVKKKSYKDEDLDIENNKIDVTEIISNQIEINCFCADGSYTSFV